MNIIAQVNWFDAPVEYFERLIPSIAPLCDAAVFLDGAYADYPHSKPYSPEATTDAIERICEECGIRWLARGTDRAFPSQTVKRIELWQLAKRIGEAHVDYTLIIDADEYIASIEAEAVREALVEYEPDTALVALDTPATSSTTTSLLGVHHPVNSTSHHGRGVPRLMNLAHDMTVGPRYHGSYMASSRTQLPGGGRERVVYKRRGSEYARFRDAKAIDLSEHIRIVNETWKRDAERLRDKHLYGLRRSMRGVDL